MSSNYVVKDSRLAYRIADRKAKKVADDLLALVRSLTPVETGTLRDGWRLKWDEPEWLVQNDVPYGRAVEYGSTHGPAQPMLGRAIAQTRARYGL